MSAELTLRRKRERWQDMALGAFLIGCVALLAGLFVVLGGWRLGHGLHVTAVFTDATGLVHDAPVVVAGVPVGRVEKLGVKGGKAVVLLDLHRDTDLPADVTAAIRARSLLGEKVVDLSGGGSSDKPLADGATITDTRTSVEADQVLTRLAPVLEKVDPDDLARLVHAAAGAVSDANLGRLYRFADRLDRLVEAGGPKVLGVLDRLDALGPRAAQVMSGVETALPATQRLLDRADALTMRTRKLVDDLDARLATPGSRVLDRADVLLGRLPSSLDRLDRLTDRLTLFIDTSQPTFDRLGLFVSDANIRRILLEDGVKIRVVP